MKNKKIVNTAITTNSKTGRLSSSKTYWIKMGLKTSPPRVTAANKTSTGPYIGPQLSLSHRSIATCYPTRKSTISPTPTISPGRISWTRLSPKCSASTGCPILISCLKLTSSLRSWTSLRRSSMPRLPPILLSLITSPKGRGSLSPPLSRQSWLNWISTLR